MRINHIHYHNYRCFENIKVKFTTTESKNVALVLGVNGAGKTEMLFSFQWVLYGFDFKKLREKDETPYSLTSSLYHELENNPHARSVDCWVELSFSFKGTEYFMRRTETFMRLNNKVTSKTKVALSHTEPNGERTTPENNPEIVEEQLARMIPNSILEGITFDGERMKKLNIADDNSKKVIKNVISLVTNEKLFELCLGEIKDVVNDIRKERNRINRSSGNTSAEELGKEISALEDAIDDDETALSGAKTNLEKVEARIDEVSLRLSDLEDAKKLEEKRKGLEKDLERAKKRNNTDTDSFFSWLKDGYFLVTDDLVADVKESIEMVDVPAGLTVEAVKSIMKRPKCICGCDMNEDIIHRLKSLLSTLPPDNISSNILYMANQFEGEKKRAKEQLKKAYESLLDSRDEIANIKAQIAEVSSSLLDESTSEEIKSLESERLNLYEKKGRYTDTIDRRTREIERNSKRLKDAKKELDEASGNQEQITELNEQENVLDLFKEAIKRIGERNQSLSLISINEYLTKTYRILSEDTGRRIYLCQFSKKEKYGLITYLQSRYKEIQTSWINTGRLKTFKDEGLSDSEIHEKIAIKAAEGKSTGQSKVNSLAFAKAILEYSNEDRSDDELSVSHDYPFLIDSPFTELSEDNLRNVARNIHSFANQVIIMADDTSFGVVKSLISPHVNTTTQLIKDKDKGITYIKH